MVMVWLIGVKRLAVAMDSWCARENIKANQLIYRGIAKWIIEGEDDS
jgi:hypothetical protein